jgi:hypothetical protein
LTWVDDESTMAATNILSIGAEIGRPRPTPQKSEDGDSVLEMGAFV